ncbi:MAG: MFS family permease [Rhodoferax sp.]|jgi:MFS family permease
MNQQRWAVGLIVLAQWLGTSLWFSPNSAADDLMTVWQIGSAQFAWLIAATQSGFIVGTLWLAYSGWADRYSTSRIFAIACVLGAVVNAGFSGAWTNFESGLLFRFAVGVCLAGIYPLGMKMIVGWVGTKSGSALGLLVGMLTLGTALPHGIRALGASLPWQAVIQASSVLAVAGAALIYFLGDGPHLKKSTGHPGNSLSRAFGVFKIADFRAAALGYFGHMWELYAFWAVLPWLAAQLLLDARHLHPDLLGSVPAISFLGIAAGFFGCVLGGRLSQKFDSIYVAAFALLASGLMCLIYPLLAQDWVLLRLIVLLVWGFFVVADSPQFSSISARSCPPEWVGSALAIQNSIGFLITIVSITLMLSVIELLGSQALWWLLPGPVLGLMGLWPLLKKTMSGRVQMDPA